MRKVLWLWALGVAVLLTAVLLLLAGCGGSGGPLVPPPDTGPSVNAQFLALLPPAQASATYTGPTACQACHATPQGNTFAIDFAAFSQTKHSQLSIGCEQCHGPGSVHVANPTNSNILTFPNLASSIVCAQCHGQKATPFDSSKHATFVADVFTSSFSNAATGRTCLRCHSAAFRNQYIDTPMAFGTTRAAVDTGILAVPDAQVKSFVDPNGTAPKESASCTNCHNPHRWTGNLLFEPGGGAGEEHQFLRLPGNMNAADVLPQTPTSQNTAHYTTENHLCGACHNGRGGDNTDAAIQASTSRFPLHNGPQYNFLLGLSGLPAGQGTAHHHGNTADNPSQCAHCHVANGVHSFNIDVTTSCAPCHEANAAQQKLALKGTTILRLAVLRSRLDTWSTTKFGGPGLWDYTSNVPAGKTAPPQGNVPLSIKHVRHNYYFVLNDGSGGIHNPDYVQLLLGYAESEMTNAENGKAAQIKMTQKQANWIYQQERARIKMQARSETDGSW